MILPGTPVLVAVPVVRVISPPAFAAEPPALPAVIATDAPAAPVPVEVPLAAKTFAAPPTDPAKADAAPPCIVTAPPAPPVPPLAPPHVPPVTLTAPPVPFVQPDVGLPPTPAVIVTAPRWRWPESSRRADHRGKRRPWRRRAAARERVWRRRQGQKAGLLFSCKRVLACVVQVPACIKSFLFRPRKVSRVRPGNEPASSSR